MFDITRIKRKDDRNADDLIITAAERPLSPDFMQPFDFPLFPTGRELWKMLLVTSY